jgi:hypothetical protein
MVHQRVFSHPTSHFLILHHGRARSTVAVAVPCLHTSCQGGNREGGWKYIKGQRASAVSGCFGGVSECRAQRDVLFWVLVGIVISPGCGQQLTGTESWARGQKVQIKPTAAGVSVTGVSHCSETRQTPIPFSYHVASQICLGLETCSIAAVRLCTGGMCGCGLSCLRGYERLASRPSRARAGKKRHTCYSESNYLLYCILESTNSVLN